MYKSVYEIETARNTFVTNTGGSAAGPAGRCNLHRISGLCGENLGLYKPGRFVLNYQKSTV